MPFEIGHKLQAWKGRKHTDATKKKMREARLKNQPMHNPDVVKRRSETLRKNGTFAGPNSNNWKGGVTPEQILIRNSQEMADWRHAVFERDNYTCQHCKARCGDGVDVHLHAHHIKGFANHPEHRLDVDNGLTLCKSCHYKEHSNA
jgi:predicted restriction endonuclease